MGTVYEAEQLEPLRRTVALKVIRLGMDTDEVLARFESERQALAVMDHPNIARVLDAGTTDEGRPYFVMELVPGEPITDYCDRHGLDLRHRLQLFIGVCRGVQHAHQKGVIHRDLKPSNILVRVTDGQPVPTIIDFGIAKATEQRLTDAAFTTELGVVVGTPAYMSPEQAEASGLDIDTRADIYSLGMVLYELMTGVLPFDHRGLLPAPFIAQYVLGNADMPTPSRRVATLEPDTATNAARHRHTTPVGLRRELRGDLDWIVVKAIERDRNRRYETANALALDLERHLENKPVTARPPTARLHRGQVRPPPPARRLGAGDGARGLLVAGVTGIERERDRAEQGAAKAQAISAFLRRPAQVGRPVAGRRAADDGGGRARGRASSRWMPAGSRDPVVAASVRRHHRIGLPESWPARRGRHARAGGVARADRPDRARERGDGRELERSRRPSTSTRESSTRPRRRSAARWRSGAGGWGRETRVVAGTLLDLADLANTTGRAGPGPTRSPARRWRSCGGITAIAHLAVAAAMGQHPGRAARRRPARRQAESTGRAAARRCSSDLGLERHPARWFRSSTILRLTLAVPGELHGGARADASDCWRSTRWCSAPSHPYFASHLENLGFVYQ